MKKSNGFTLIEMVLFITVTSILASTILLSTSALLRGTPTLQSNLVASAYVTQNIEYYIGLRRTQGYSAIPCPSTTVPSFDTSITGYTVTESISCTTLNGDANYKTLVTTATGSGINTGAATATILFANY
jgi:type II secretory pathway pseudopilin PulG